MGLFPTLLDPSADAPTALRRWALHYAPYTAQPDAVREALAALVAQGLDRLPLPGIGPGATLRRWRRLAEVCGVELSLGKLYESHADALAILAELGAKAPAGARLGVWAAEPPTARVELRRSPAGSWRLTGRKAWCSGAQVLSHALVSGWDDQHRQCLVLVALDQPAVVRTGEGWHAVGMAATGSGDVLFRDAVALPVGGPGAYTGRAGFWHGAAGIAACWHGAAAAIAETLRREAASRPHVIGPHGHAHLGRADAALHAARALLRETAALIDAAPTRSHHLAVQRVRVVVEAAANTVIEAVGRALGASPFCRDPDFARRLADLPVFLRQSHAERDLEAIGGQVAVTARLHPKAPPAAASARPAAAPAKVTLVKVAVPTSVDVALAPNSVASLESALPISVAVSTSAPAPASALAPKMTSLAASLAAVAQPPRPPPPPLVFNVVSTDPTAIWGL